MEEFRGAEAEPSQFTAEGLHPIGEGERPVLKEEMAIIQPPPRTSATVSARSHGTALKTLRGHAETFTPPHASSDGMSSTFSDGTVGIRRFREEDVISLYEAVHESVHELSTWMTWCHRNYSLKDTVHFLSAAAEEWENGTQYSFAICDVTNGTLLGSVGLNQINQQHNLANLGYWVRTGSTHRGVAPAATRLAARFAFGELNFSRLELLVPVGNTFSQRVAEKAGAKNEGILRSRLRLQGTLHDSFVYSLVPADMQPATATAKSSTQSARAARR